MYVLKVRLLLLLRRGRGGLARLCRCPTRRRRIWYCLTESDPNCHFVEGYNIAEIAPPISIKVEIKAVATTTAAPKSSGPT